jgi:sigma-B regulation protein RsbU (phosphoserine phosphatase)
MSRSGIQHALFGTLPGRAIVIGVAIRLAVYAIGTAMGGVPVFLNVIDTVASIGLAVGAGYFGYRLILLGKHRLLWRVRRKLILSYVFIGFIPAALIVSFFLLSGFLLFYNFGSYLVQSRLRAIGDQARFLAQSTVLEIQRGAGRDAAGIITRRQDNADDEFPGLSIAVVPVNRACDAASRPSSLPALPSPIVAGAWAHVSPPTTLPDWIKCDGFAGVLAYSHGGVASTNHTDGIVIRAVAFPDGPRPTFAVVYDVPVGAAVKERLRSETGVSVSSFAVLRDVETDAKPLPSRVDDDGAGAAESDSSSILPILVYYRDWSSGKNGSLSAQTALRVGELYQRISSGPRRLGQGLLLALFVIGGLFIVIEAMALFVGLALAKSITGSVHELFAGTERVRQGDFTHKIAVKAQDQLGELAQSFNSMTASIEDLLREQAEKKRLEEELRIAREIQMSLLPQGPFEMPGLSITAVCVPAREVGGDYYDFLPLDDHRLGLLIADVSGKGTSAALYMAELKGLVLSLSLIHTSPRELMIAANRIIANNLDSRSFITMTYAVIDVHARTMTYARAGHTPLMYVPDGVDGSRNAQVLVPDGMVLGLKLDDGEMFDRLLEEQTIHLASGDLFVLFTDGISEAMNVADDCFGEARLGRILEDHASLPSEELRERVLREVAAFVGDAPQHDDMTMILLKVEELPAEALHHRGVEQRRPMPVHG